MDDALGKGGKTGVIAAGHTQVTAEAVCQSPLVIAWAVALPYSALDVFQARVFQGVASAKCCYQAGQLGSGAFLGAALASQAFEPSAVIGVFRVAQPASADMDHGVILFTGRHGQTLLMLFNVLMSRLP